MKHPLCKCCKHYTLTYPNEMTITEDTLKSWYDDAVYDGEVDLTSLTNLDAIAFHMEVMGLITLKPKREDNDKVPNTISSN